MALQVWLPFYKEVKNEGLADVKIVNQSNGFEISNTNKFVTCGHFSRSSSGYISATGFTNFGSELSLCTWVCFDSISASNGQTIVCSRKSAYNGFFVVLDTNNKLVIDGAIGSSSQRWTTSFTAAADTWYHIGITIKNGLISLYINGEFLESKTVTPNATGYGSLLTIGCLNNNGSSFSSYLDGYLYDLKIYDHCLSAKEVHEDSQALILHLPLNDEDFNGNIVYDCSGRHDDAEVTYGAITEFSENTPRYRNAARFNGSSFINCGQGCWVKSTITVSVWVYSSTASSFVSCVESGGWGFQAGKRYFGTGASSNSYLGTTSSLLPSAYRNKWNHFVITYDWKTLKTYRNSVLYSTASRSKNTNIFYNYNSTLWLGCEATGSTTKPPSTNYPLTGYMSDFRVYATALSDDDILELYKLGASVDNLQNVHTFEYYEDGAAANPSITKTGIVKESELEEADKASLFSSGKVTAKELIEI